MDAQVGIPVEQVEPVVALMVKMVLKVHQLVVATVTVPRVQLVEPAILQAQTSEQPDHLLPVELVPTVERPRVLMVVQATAV